MICFLKYFAITATCLLLFVGTIIGMYYSTRLPWPLMMIATAIMIAIDGAAALLAMDKFYTEEEM